MQFRWLTEVLHGQWWASADDALEDALRAGQAVRPGEGEEVSLREFATIEQVQDEEGERACEAMGRLVQAADDFQRARVTGAVVPFGQNPVR